MQEAVPSPHTEYLSITYCEGSNADRSSALGLRLNQQDKETKKNRKTHPVISTMSVPFAKCFQPGLRLRLVTSRVFYGLETGISAAFQHRGRGAATYSLCPGQQGERVE